MNKGRPAASARSDHSDMDPDEAELGKLQRQHRILEKDHQAYKIQAQREIHKQEQEMKQLLKEQDELHRKLGACKTVSRLQQDSKNIQCLQALLQESDTLDKQIKEEKQCQQELQKEISKMELKVAEVTKGEASKSAAERSEKQRAQKAIANLQYKLDKALTRFNEQMSTNKRLRQEVQTLYIERVRFQQLHNRLNKELQEVRKKTTEVTNLSNAAYDARVEVQSKMAMMREKAWKDCAQYNAEMKELQRVIASESNTKGFMSTKCSKKNEGDNDQGLGPRQLSKLKEQNRMDSEEGSLDALEEMFKRNQLVTEEDDLDLLVTRFIQAEDRNFALYNFVTEQMKGVEALRDEISQIQEEMEQFQVKGLQQEQDHQSQLRDIEEKRKEIELQAEDYENQGSSISKILDEIMTGINSIFSKLEYDRSKAEDLLGSSAGITENNIMFYLGLLEQKTNELLTVQAFLNSKDPEKDYNPKDLAQILLGQNPELLQQSIRIQAEVNRVDYDAEESPVTDEEERPFSQAELRKRIMKEAQQKESPAQRATKKSLKDQSGVY
ncbi:coiled-coil domain-containing protein 114 [Acanthochromis polyacanthus]|uniref:Coiled-coil domain-containing protein 63-like n=1 Tax=Acanthochromis polyacanthus TaxID=80966 RepID=A0A3Q1FC01_9TELE|nr:coiled-coil domain-containing protein 114 [Acanthochromis polyacanthus]